MLNGNIHLSLMIGPVVPVPMPREVVDALRTVTVRRSTDEQSGFQLDFEFSSSSPLNTILLMLGKVGPFVRVVLTAVVNGTPNVLMDGVVVNHQVTPDVHTGRATLTVTGSDLTAVMRFVKTPGIPYPAMPREARVALIVAKYAVYGMIPLVVPSLLLDVPVPVNAIPTHQGSDLEYLQQLAAEVGYVFYVDPGPAPLTNIAYWGPRIKVGPPQPALNVNMDVHTNVESLSFQLDGTARVTPVVFVQNELTKVSIPIPIPDIDPLNPPLGIIPPFAARVEPVQDAAKLNPVQAAAVGMATAATSSDAVTANGSLDVLRYGHVLKARGLVGVRGAGDAFDGLYYVKSVTHNLARGEYKQEFTLTRNGLLPTVPRVPA